MSKIRSSSVSEYEKSITKRIDILINKNFKSMKQFAEHANIPYQRLYEILRNRQHLHVSHLGKIIKGLGGNFISIFTNEEYVRADSVPSLDDPNDQPYVPVPTVSPATCGSSGAITSGEIEGYKYFSESFVSQYRNPLLTIASGDSMSPYIQDRDMLLISRGEIERTHPNSKDFYLVNNPETSEELGITVKRVKLSNNNLILIPQNPEYEIQEIDIKNQSLLNIIFGRVVWIGRELNSSEPEKIKKDSKKYKKALNSAKAFVKKIKKQV